MNTSCKPMLIILALAGSLHAAAAPRSAASPANAAATPATTPTESDAPGFAVGDKVADSGPWRRFFAASATSLRKIDGSIPDSAYLGAVGGTSKQISQPAAHTTPGRARPRWLIDLVPPSSLVHVNEKIFEALRDKPWAALGSNMGSEAACESMGEPVGSEPATAFNVIKLVLLVAAYLSSAAAFTIWGITLERTRSQGAKRDYTAGFTCSTDDLTCPITCEMYIDPVSLVSGSTFERSAITEWLRTHRTDPLTNTVLASKRLVPNTAVRSLAQRFCEKGAENCGHAEHYRLNCSCCIGALWSGRASGW